MSGITAAADRVRRNRGIRAQCKVITNSDGGNGRNPQHHVSNTPAELARAFRWWRTQVCGGHSKTLFPTCGMSKRQIAEKNRQIASKPKREEAGDYWLRWPEFGPGGIAMARGATAS